METQTNARDLQGKIKGFIEELAKETDLARKSEVIQKYLEFTARFHQYSSNNIWLILMTRPDATHVAGFQAWKGMGRNVKRGEKGIAIFAPMINKEVPDREDSPKVLHGFRIVYVFDVTQTDGEPLPPVPDWKSPEKNAELTERLLRFVESKGIKITFKHLLGDVQGLSRGKEIEIDVSAGFKTVVHECCHSLIHFNNSFSGSRAIKELQAEATAFVVAKHFGIARLNSANYLTLFDLTSQDIYGHLEIIQRTASEIIKGIEQNEE